MKKFIGFSIGPIAGAFISFITIPLTTYFINPNEFGKASMFSLFQLILANVLYIGIDQAYTREYHTNKNKLNLLQNAMIIPMSFAFIILLITILIPRQISMLIFESPDYILPSLLFGFMTIFMVIERFIILSIRMQEKALEYSLINIIIRIVILASTILFIVFIRRDFLAIVYSAIIGQIIGDTYLIIRYKYIFNISSLVIEKKLIKQMMLFGLPLVFSTSLSSILNSFDRIALRTWSNFYEIGIYTATLKISSLLTIIQSSFTSFWVPTAYRWYEEGKELRYFKLISDFILLLMSMMFMGILMFKKYIVLLLSAEYAQSEYLIAFLCLVPIMYTLSETTCLGIVFSRKSYLNIYVGLIAIIPNLALNIYLVPKYGAVGSAIAISISYIFFFAARTYFSKRNGMNFPIIKHSFVILFLLFAAIINLIDSYKGFLINSLLLLILIIIQFTTIKSIWKIYKKKTNKEWDFS